MVTFANSYKTYISVTTFDFLLKQAPFLLAQTLQPAALGLYFCLGKPLPPRKRDQLSAFPVGKARSSSNPPWFRGVCCLTFWGVKVEVGISPKSFPKCHGKILLVTFLTTYENQNRRVKIHSLWDVVWMSGCFSYVWLFHKYFIYSSDMFGSYSGWDTATTGFRNLIIIFTLFILLLEEDLLATLEMVETITSTKMLRGRRFGIVALRLQVSSVQYHGNLRVPPSMTPPGWLWGVDSHDSMFLDWNHMESL